MRYYIVEEKEKYILFKVADDLIVCFENKHKQKSIAEGRSIMEVLMEFDKAEKRSSIEFDTEARKYKNANT